MRLTLATLVIVCALIVSLLYFKTKPSLIQVVPLDPVIASAKYCLPLAGIRHNSEISCNIELYTHCIRTMLLAVGGILSNTSKSGIVRVLSCICRQVAKTDIGSGTLCSSEIGVLLPGSKRHILKKFNITTYLIPVDCHKKIKSKYIMSVALLVKSDKLPILIRVYPTVRQSTCTCHIVRECPGVRSVIFEVNCTCIGNVDRMINMRLIVMDERTFLNATFDLARCSS